MMSQDAAAKMLEGVKLAAGRHAERSLTKGICPLEAVAWLAGEPHTDKPETACRIVGGFVRALNDALTDAQRETYMRSLIPRLLGTRTDKAGERRRLATLLKWLLHQADAEGYREDKDMDIEAGIPVGIHGAGTVGGRLFTQVFNALIVSTMSRPARLSDAFVNSAVGVVGRMLEEGRA